MPSIGVNGTGTPTTITGGNETLAPTGGNETLTPTIVDSNNTLAPTSGNDTGPVSSSALEFLAQTLTDDGSISTQGTPQFEALAALSTSNPELNATNEDDQLEITQRYALNSLYFATNGASWLKNDQWASASHPCGSATDTPWFGVTCDDAFTVVEVLSLPSNDLLGMLPSEIRGLSGLQSLNVFENQLNGQIPDAIGELTTLTVLEAGSNFLDSTIPPSIGNLTSLEILNLYSNLLSGGIPAEIGQLQALRALSLETNFLVGPLPPELFTLSSIGTSR
jgi:hypothetical protein